MNALSRHTAGFDRWLDASLAGRVWAAIMGALVRAEEPDIRLSATDRAIALLLGLLAALVATAAQHRMPAGLYTMSGFDIWFQADQPRVLGALSDRLSTMHYRDNVHPLFSLIAYPLAWGLRLLGLSPLAAGEAMVALAAMGSTCLLFLLVRQSGGDRLTALLGGLGFIASATFLHWFTLLETYALSSFCAILAIWLMARRPAPSALSVVGATLASLAMVITNVTLGIALAATRLRLGRFVRLMVLALVLAVGLSAAQHRIFPHAPEFFRRSALVGEEKFVGNSETGDTRGAPSAAIDKLRGALITPAVAPLPCFDTIPKSGKIILNNQRAPLAAYGPWARVAGVAWLGMLALSLRAMLRERRFTPTLVAAGGFLLGQVALHLVYGDITFLYAADFFVVLMLLACQGGSEGVRGHWREAHRLALACFVVSAGIANWQGFGVATGMAAHAVDLAGAAAASHASR